MQIEMYEIPLRRIFEGYEDKSDNEGGVFALDGRLTCRPAYQREFVYKDKQRDEVIQTIRKEFPLNVMYWVRTDQHKTYDIENETPEERKKRHEEIIETGTFELLDGQQRTLSALQFLNHDYPIDWDGNKMFIQNIEKSMPDIYEKMLDYKFSVYICEGSQSEVLDWFKIINIAGEKLTNQELLNAIYTGPWLADAKKYFSKTNCTAYQMASKLITGSPIRQDYLETALKWITEQEGKNPVDYMAQHQNDSNANELWAYFSAVITWVNMLFPKNYYKANMKGQPWGELYNHYHEHAYDAEELNKKVDELLLDDEITNYKGIYPYLFTEDEKYLSLREFTDKQKLAQYQKQAGVCKICKQHFEYEEMEGDHIVPWHDGGKTVPENLQMLCKHCNRTKSGK